MNASIRGMVGSLLLIGLVTLCGCGDDGDSGGGAGGQGGAGMGGAAGSGGSGGGSTMCGISVCEAGQHCFNGVCINGCLTGNNCNSNQTCEDIDPTTNIGTCRDRPVTPTKDCDAFCAKAHACQAPEAPQCMDLCVALSVECVTCVTASNCNHECDAQCSL